MIMDCSTGDETMSSRNDGVHEIHVYVSGDSQSLFQCGIILLSSTVHKVFNQPATSPDPPMVSISR